MIVRSSPSCAAALVLAGPAARRARTRAPRSPTSRARSCARRATRRSTSPTRRRASGSSTFIQLRIDRVLRRQSADQARARRNFGAGDPRRAAAQGLRPARVVAAARRRRRAARLVLAFGVWRWSRGRDEPPATSGARSSTPETEQQIDELLARGGLMGDAPADRVLAGFVVGDHAVRAAARARLPLGALERRGGPARGARRRAARRASSLPFILGFTVVFVVLGAGAAAIGSVVSTAARRPRSPASCSSCSASRSSGCCRCPSGSSRRGSSAARAAAARASLLGGAFAVCAAPCIGTVLAAVLVLASDTGTVAQGRGAARRVRARARRAFLSRASRSRARWARSAGCATATRSSRS